MKLPITPLLYVVSLGSLAGIVHSVIQYTDKSGAYDQRARQAIRNANENLKKQGVKTNVGDERWNYASDWYWYQFRNANFIGKVEVKKIDNPETKKTEDPKPEIIDLKTVFDVICITSAGAETGVVIKYKPEANVTVPEGLKPKPSTSVMNTVPKGRRIPRPAVVSLEPPPHHLRVGEKLWPKFDHVVLKSVSSDARSATFELQLPDKKDAKGNFPFQPISKGVLGLPPGVAEMIRKARNGGKGTAGGTENPSTPDKVPDSTWVDTPETTIARDGRVNVARKDQRFLEERGPEIFNDDVHMRDYSGGSGRHKIRGVRIRKLSNRVRQFGINVDDVIISINNVKVTGMASAKKVGRRLYNKGVRNFKAEILRQGRIITRTYTFKK